MAHMTQDEYRLKCVTILEKLPEEFRSALENFCYQEFHGCGYEEVLLHLHELVDNLKEPCRLFARRIQTDTTFLCLGEENPKNDVRSIL
jgi:hypothetical protein